LLKENEILKESLAGLHKELNDMITIRRDVYVRRRKMEMGEEYAEDDSDLNEIQLLPFKKELFAMPADTVR